MIDIENKKEWCADQHRKVNHLYGNYDYQLHLDAVETVHKQFQDEAPKDIPDSVLYKACYGHDLIEDTRLTYNDIKDVLGMDAAEIIYALTNSKGRTRAERANKNYYHNIRLTPGAQFVKICDRIANVRFSKFSGSRMFYKYREENLGFMNSIEANKFPRMKQELENLFKII